MMINENAMVIPAKIPEKKSSLKVAAYCRVSSESDEQLMSLESQIRYYTRTIQENPEWEFAGVYAERVTGTDFKKRDEFNRMIKDAKAGEIDLILTKSISRFGRNTVPFLQSFYELSQKGVVVRFEIEDIRTDDPDVAMVLSILAAIAQAESESRSKDIKWGIRRNYEKGKVQLNHSQFLGYTKDTDGNLVIVEEEAEIVRLIFDLYLKGNGCRKIKKYLEEHGIKTVTGKDTWSTATIDRMLSNEKYVGNALLQKTFVENPLTHKQVKNMGQQSMFLVENSHEAIISRDVFERVQRRKGVKTDAMELSLEHAVNNPASKQDHAAFPLEFSL